MRTIKIESVQEWQDNDPNSTSSIRELVQKWEVRVRFDTREQAIAYERVLRHHPHRLLR